MIWALPLLLFQPPQDIQSVPGIARLQNIKWGMTVSEADMVIGVPRTLIQKPYRDISYLQEMGETGLRFDTTPRVQRWSRPYIDRITLKAIKFGGYTGEAFIQTRPHSDTVCCIVLRLPLKLDSRSDWYDAQIKMNETLISKYGWPKLNSDPVPVWSFPSTNVSFVTSPLHFFIVYEAVR